MAIRFLPGRNQYSQQYIGFINSSNFLPLENITLSNTVHPGKNSLDILNKNQDSVVASAGKHKILLNDFISRYTDYLAATGIKDNPMVRTSILTNMINELALRYYDSNKDIYNNINFQQEIAWTKKQAVLGFLKDREIYAKINVTDEELRTTFERVNEKISVRHLYAPTEEEANNLYTLLQKGADFHSLAKQVFTDSILSNNGGYLGYFTWGDMDPDFENAAFSLKKGEVSSPVKTVYGWSIIKLEDRISNPVITEFEYLQKKHHLERVLKIKKKIPCERAYLNNVFDPSKLSFDNLALNKLLVEIAAPFSGDQEINASSDRSTSYLTYDGKKTFYQEIKNQINQIPFYYRDKIKNIDDLKEAISGLIIQQRLLKIANSKGYADEPLVLNMFNKLSDMVFLRYKREEIIGKAYISDSAVKTFYAKNIKMFSLPDELKLQEIIVASPDLADSLKRELTKGADFGQLAEKNSIRTWTSKNKGIIGFAPLERYGMFKEKFWDAPIDQLLGPIKIEKYYGLFKVLGKKHGDPIDFNLAKNEAARLAKKELQTQIMKDYLEVLKKKITVKINEDLLLNYKIDPAYSQ